jgi:hypothetical protein
MTKQEDRLAQVQQAILQEREKRECSVVVNNPRRTYSIAGIPIPGNLQGYVADTTCTVKHHHDIPCQWLDYVFYRGEQAYVVLWNEFARSGLLTDRIRVVFAELSKGAE